MKNLIEINEDNCVLNAFDINIIKKYIDTALAGVFSQKELSPEQINRMIEHGEQLKLKITRLNDLAKQAKEVKE